MLVFEDLTNIIRTALPVMMKEENGVTPGFYICTLVESEDFINEAWDDRDGRKTLAEDAEILLSLLSNQ